MDRNKQREIASKGGKAAHARGTAHQFTSAEARVAGRKGANARKDAVSPNCTAARKDISHSRVRVVNDGEKHDLIEHLKSL